MDKSIAYTLFVISPLFLLLPVGMDMYLPVLPELKRYFLVSDDTTIGFTVTIYLLMMGFSELFFGPVSDSWGRKKVALLGCALFIVGSIFCIFSTSISLFIFGRAIQSIGGGACFVSTFAIARDLFSGNNLTRVLSYVNGSLAVCPVIAPSIGAYLTLHENWIFLFKVLSILGVMGFIFIFLMLPETLEKQPKNGENVIDHYKTILKNRDFLNYTSKALVGASAFSVYLTLSPILLINILGRSKSEFAVLFAVNAGVFMIGSFITPSLVIRYGLKRIANIALLFVFVGVFLLMIFSKELSVLRFILPFMVCAIGATLLLGACPGGAMEPFKTIAGTAGSLFAIFTFGLGSALTTLLTYFMPINSVLPIVCIILFTLLFSIAMSRITAYRKIKI